MARIILKMSYKEGKENRGKDLAHLKYIANRPGSKEMSFKKQKELEQKDPMTFKKIKERTGGFRVFGNGYEDMLEENEGVVWRGVLSLKKEDAIKTGYDNRDEWENLMKEKIPKMASEMNIPLNKLSWLAAYHHKESNPHVHFIIWENHIDRYDDMDRKKYLKKQYGKVSQESLNKIKSTFARSIFQEEFKQLNKKKEMSQKQFQEELKKDIANEKGDIARSSLNNKKNKGKIIPDINSNKNRTKERIRDFLLLANETKQSKTKRFGYLSPKGKAITYKIANELLEENGYRESYKAYRRAIKESIEFYKDDVKKEDIDNAEEKLRMRLNNIIVKNAAELEVELRKDGLDLEKEIQEQIKAFEKKGELNHTLSVLNKTATAVFRELQKEELIQEIEMQKYQYRMEKNAQKEKKMKKANKERGR